LANSKGAEARSVTMNGLEIAVAIAFIAFFVWFVQGCYILQRDRDQFRKGIQPGK
jgi:hypothetical protein